MNPLIILGAVGAGVALWALSQKSATAAPAPVTPEPGGSTLCTIAKNNLIAAAKAAYDAQVVAAADPTDKAKVDAANAATAKGTELLKAWPTACGTPPTIATFTPPQVVNKSAPVTLSGVQDFAASAKMLDDWAAKNQGNPGAFASLYYDPLSRYQSVQTPSADSQNPNITAANPFGEPLFTPQQRTADVPRVASWTIPTQVGPSSGSCGPDLQFPSGVWPIASSKITLARGNCDGDPMFAGQDKGRVQLLLDQWGADLNQLTDPANNLSAADTTRLTSDMATTEQILMAIAPGAFVRYLAALFSIFVSAKPEVDHEGDRSQAIANHVILVCQNVLKQNGYDPTIVPYFPFVWVPRDGTGNLVVPTWTGLHLFPW